MQTQKSYTRIQQTKLAVEERSWMPSGHDALMTMLVMGKIGNMIFRPASYQSQLLYYRWNRR